MKVYSRPSVDIPPFSTVGTSEATRDVSVRFLLNPIRPSESCLSTENSNKELARCGSRELGSPPKFARSMVPEDGKLVAVGAAVAAISSVGAPVAGTAVASAPQATANIKANNPTDINIVFMETINPTSPLMPTGHETRGFLSCRFALAKCYVILTVTVIILRKLKSPDSI